MRRGLTGVTAYRLQGAPPMLASATLLVDATTGTGASGLGDVAVTVPCITDIDNGDSSEWCVVTENDVFLFARYCTSSGCALTKKICTAMACQ